MQYFIAIIAIITTITLGVIYALTKVLGYENITKSYDILFKVMPEEALQAAGITIVAIVIVGIATKILLFKSGQELEDIEKKIMSAF